MGPCPSHPIAAGMCLADWREAVGPFRCGGHHYDTPEFEDICLGLNDAVVDLVLTSQMENKAATENHNRQDAILFLNQNKDYPTSAKNRKQYTGLANLGAGMVIL